MRKVYGQIVFGGVDKNSNKFRAPEIKRKACAECKSTDLSQGLGTM